jgi:parallel beta-helix repeat protein
LRPRPAGSGWAGCYASIQAGVDAVDPGGTVSVAAGTYAESVSIGKPLSLVGAGAAATMIDATGLENGVVVDGVGSATTVSGFTVENADWEGVLVENSSQVTIRDNTLSGNDKGLTFGPGGPTCPGNPWPLDSFDCGEAIHLLAASSSTVAHNLVEANSGGILLSDETGPTHGNTIVANTVQNNPFDCGITLASHVFQLGAPVSPSVGGIYDNAIVNNISSGNGVISGEGAGVGLFAAQPGAATYDNTVAHNTLTGNGLPGVAVHSHAPFQNLNGNTIANNTISGNGPDDEEGIAGPPDTTGIDVLSDPGAAPIAHITISANRFDDEHYGIFTANVQHVGGLPSNKYGAAVAVPVFQG